MTPSEAMRLRQRRRNMPECRRTHDKPRNAMLYALDEVRALREAGAAPVEIEIARQRALAGYRAYLKSLRRAGSRR